MHSLHTCSPGRIKMCDPTGTDSTPVDFVAEKSGAPEGNILTRMAESGI